MWLQRALRHSLGSTASRAVLSTCLQVWKLFRQQRKQYYLFEFAMSQRAKAEQEQQ